MTETELDYSAEDRKLIEDIKKEFAHESCRNCQQYEQQGKGCRLFGSCHPQPKNCTWLIYTTYNQRKYEKRSAKN